VHELLIALGSRLAVVRLRAGAVRLGPFSLAQDVTATR
jgi:hypothetical protein